MSGRPVAIEPRFHARYIVMESGCWQWTGTIATIGYGVISWNNRLMYAHQVSYLLHKGDIPEGLEIDHLCENKACVNPEHLEAVTHQINNARAAIKRRKSHCKYGHPLSGENLGLHRTQSGRYCRICNSRRATEWNRARR